MTAVTKLVAVGGSVIGAALVTHRMALYLACSALAFVAAGVVVMRRTVTAPSLGRDAHNIVAPAVGD